MENKNSSGGIPWKLTLGALGVVYGDIGTSPLYAMRECFTGHHPLALNLPNVLGVLSLIFWALVLIISIKYLAIVLTADNHGEGGILALLTLTSPHRYKDSSVRRRMLIYMGLIGAAFLYGDGVITPAISVLSAVEGLSIIAPTFETFIIPVTLIILFLIFYFQRFGTARIGSVFGPIILVWFITLGTLGAIKAFDNPVVFTAVNPLHAIRFFAENGFGAFLTLGAVFLVVTGGESLYADMGHFGRQPIRLGWFFVALPGLLLNYMGQGALLLSKPSSLENPFYLLAPGWALIPLVLLATCATVIASQAVISGAFSLTNQAVQLGYLPRMSIIHTSDEEAGQIYIEFINWTLLLITVLLVLEFKTSSALASAYGIAVSSTMVLTSVFIAFVARRLWKWPVWSIALVAGLLFAIDLAFFSANALKMFDGGWVPILMAMIIFVLMTTWRSGRNILFSRLNESLLPLDHFLKGLHENPPMRIPGTAVFMNRTNIKVPQALAMNVKHNKVLHEKNILLSVVIDDVPYVDEDSAIKIENMKNGFQRMTLTYGFMEVPDVPALLEKIRGPNKIVDFTNVTFFLGKETLFATDRPGMAIWREQLFAFMSRNAQPATNFFRIPKERVVEIGLQIEL